MIPYQKKENVVTETLEVDKATGDWEFSRKAFATAVCMPAPTRLWRNSTIPPLLWSTKMVKCSPPSILADNYFEMYHHRFQESRTRHVFFDLHS